MNKLSFFLLLIMIICTTSFSQSSQKNFEIKGTVSGYSDSTLLYLEDITTNSPVRIDSTFIINNRFLFRGSLNQTVTHVLIQTATGEDYKFFWLENATIAFNAQKGKMREANILGSKTQEEEKQLDSLIKASGNEKQSTIDFIKKHPASIVSANVLNVYATTWGKDTVAMLYKNLSAALKSSQYGNSISHYIKLNRNIKIGDKYADFTMPNTEGKNVSLSDYKNKVILLEFWGSWCEPCRKGNPTLVAIYNQYKGKGFDILGVAADEVKKDWLDAVKQDSLPWQNVTDLKGDKNKASLIYGIDRYPFNYLIDKNGIIIAKNLRGDNLRNKLKELLK